jgi:hypothetical protein
MVCIESQGLESIGILHIASPQNAESTLKKAARLVFQGSGSLSLRHRLGECPISLSRNGGGQSHLQFELLHTVPCPCHTPAMPC